MNDQELGRAIARSLDAGTMQLDTATFARLQMAREQALKKYPATQPVLGLVSSSSNSDHHGWFSDHRWWAPLLALLLGLMVIAYWQSAQSPAGDAGEVDTELLSDDLPVHAYTNYIIEGWIQHASQ